MKQPSTGKMMPALPDSVPAGIIWYDPAGNITSANQVACEFFHCEEKALLGNPLAALKIQLLSQEGKLIVYDDLPLSRALREKKPQPGRIMGIRGPGNEPLRWGIAAAAPVLKSNGEIDRAILIFIDSPAGHSMFPDWSTTEVAMRNLLEFNREIISCAGEGIIVYDKNGRYVVWNKFMEQLTGRCAADILGKSAFDQFPHLKEAQFDLLLSRALGGETVKSPRYQFHDPRTGKVSQLKSTYAPHRDSAGAIIGAIALVSDITGREVAEEAARIAEERYNALWESTFDLLFVVDDKGNFLDANRSCHELTGYGKGELAGLNLSALLDRAGLDIAMDRIGAMLVRRERSVITEYRIRGKDGRSIAVEATASPIYRDGKPIALQVVARDITARKIAEESLREIEMRFRTLVDSSFDFVYLHSLDGTCTEANKASFQATGYSPDDPGSLSLTSVLDDESLQKALTMLNKLLRGEEQGGLAEYHVRTKDGSWIDIEASSSMLYHDGKPFAVQAVARNITPRKRMEAELRKSEERFRSVFEQATFGMIMTDNKYRFIKVNDALCSMLGYAKEDLLGKTYEDITHPDYTDDDLDNIRRLERGELKMYRTQKPYLHKDGRLVWGDLAVTIPRGSGGEALCGLATIENITARKKAEEELSRLEKIESLKVLAGGIAHDFNNLLCGVFGYLDLARSTLEPGSEASLYLDKAFSSFERAKNLSLQMLTFARGGAPIKKALYLEKIIRDCCGLALSGSMARADIRIDESLHPIEGDEHQLSQVFSNIIINAVQAMPDGGNLTITAGNCTIAADTVGMLPAGTYAAVAVKDDGIGIPEKFLTRIFDPFFTTKNKGSGLGLATSYSIVTRHGGHIEVASTPGEGSTFTVFLPAPEGLVVAEETDEQETDLCGSGRILIMDDERAVREIARDILTVAGYEVTITADGSQAVACYREALDAGTPFGAVILDLTVPGGMGGEKTMAELAAIDSSAAGIVSSGFSENPVLADFAAYGFAGMVPKPYRSKDLLKAVKTVMEMKRIKE
jgi:PAS domain S-box-containing protein